MQNNKKRTNRAFHDLVGLMSHCEANYLILTGILPEKAWQKLNLETTVGQQLEIFFLEQAKYTTTIRILLSPIKNFQKAGNIEWIVRLYHDAELAEVIENENGRQLKARYCYPNRTMKHPDEKFQMNEHLGDWLLRCVIPQNNAQKELQSKQSIVNRK